MTKQEWWALTKERNKNIFTSILEHCCLSRKNIYAREVLNWLEEMEYLYD